jgi:hypothetical protein
VVVIFETSKLKQVTVLVEPHHIGVYKEDWKSKLKLVVKGLGYMLVEFDDVAWDTIENRLRQQKTMSSRSTSKSLGSSPPSGSSPSSGSNATQISGRSNRISTFSIQY